ncbi:19945_t:CDS:2, partial [Racocetra fulgida]
LTTQKENYSELASEQNLTKNRLEKTSASLARTQTELNNCRERFSLLESKKNELDEKLTTKNQELKELNYSLETIYLLFQIPPTPQNNPGENTQEERELLRRLANLVTNYHSYHSLSPNGSLKTRGNYSFPFQEEENSEREFLTLNDQRIIYRENLKNLTKEELVTKIQALENELLEKRTSLSIAESRLRDNELEISNLKEYSIRYLEVVKENGELKTEQTINRFEQEKLQASFEPPPSITYPQSEEVQIRPKEMETTSTQTDEIFPN